MANLEDRCAYFAIKNDAYASPKSVYKKMGADPASICVVDVRNAVAPIPSRNTGSIWVPENEVEKRMSELSRDKPLVLHCWDMWCGLASQAAVPLLNAGYDVKELHGGIKAWLVVRQPVDKLTDANALVIQ